MTCCLLRRKIIVAVVGVLSEEDCGVSDSEMADVLLFDPDKSERPILALRYCPWCGRQRSPESETRVTEVHGPPEE